MWRKIVTSRLLIGIAIACFAIILVCLAIPLSTTNMSISRASTLQSPSPLSTSISSSSTTTPASILSITEGTVLVLKSGTSEWIEGQIGMTLEEGDTIKAGKNSRVVITFFDGSSLELEADTQIEVISLNVTSDTGSTTIKLKQVIGKTISRIKKLFDPASSYEIETPGGVAAVRGSIMVTLVDGSGKVTVGNAAGTVCLRNMGRQVCMPVGTQSSASPGQPPSPPVPAPQLLLLGGGYTP